MLLFLFVFLDVDVSIGNNVDSPRIEEIIQKRLQNVGTKFTILCSLQEGARPVLFEWYKNGHLLLTPTSNFNSHRIATSEDESHFIIEKLSESDSANYSCSVRNKFGSDTQFTVLTVKGLTFFLFKVSI